MGTTKNTNRSYSPKHKGNKAYKHKIKKCDVTERKTAGKNRGTKELQNQYKTVNKMAVVNLFLSIITLKVNVLNCQ